MTATSTTSPARATGGVSSTGTRAGLPSSARRSATPADEDASLPVLGDDEMGAPDAEDWPGQFGAARLGIP